MIQVLMVDDDEAFTELVAQYLNAEGGFEFSSVTLGKAGIEAISNNHFDVVLLDVGLPDTSGFEVLKRVQQNADCAIIMLTARGDDLDRILGLEIGADDYVAKPCNLRELTARIRNLSRRLKAGKTADAQTLTAGELALHPSRQAAYYRQQQLNLTSAEYLVLECLTSSAGEVVDKNTLAQHALGRRSQPYDRSIDTHISNLRKKLGPTAQGGQLIKTVRNRGYLLVL